MSHALAKQIVNEDGDTVAADMQVWHFVTSVCGDAATLCTGEFIGEGASCGTYQAKEVKRGGITCEDCLGIIKEFKAVRL